MRAKSSPYSSRVKTTPDGELRIASKSSLPSACPARRTASGYLMAQLNASAHSAAAASSPAGSVGPSVS